MKRRIRIGLAVLAGIIVLVIILGLAVPRMIDMSFVRNRIIEQAQSALGRNVKMGDVQLRLIPSIRVYVAGLEIAESEEFGEQPFVTMDQLYVKVKLIPLLRKRVVIDRVILVEPRISIVRSAGGTFNFDDIVRREPEKGQAVPEKVGPSPVGESAPPRVTLAGVHIRQGELKFLDKQSVPETAIEVSKLNVNARDLSPNVPVKFDVSADVLGGSFSASGSVKPTPPLERIRADIDATFRDINLGLLKSYMKNFQSEEVSGQFTVSLSDEEQSARWRGTLSLGNYSVSVPGRPGGSISGRGFSIDGSASARYDLKEASFDGKIRIENLGLAALHPTVSKAKVGRFEFDGSGSLTGGSRAFKVAAKTTVSELSTTARAGGKQWDIGAQQAVVDLSANYQEAEAETSGNATVALSLDKPTARSAAGEVYSLSALRLEKAKAVLRNNEVSFELPSAALGKTVFEGRGKVSLPAKVQAAGTKRQLAYDAAFDFGNVSLDELATIVPALANYSPSGNVTLSVAATGKSGQAPSAVKGSAEFKNVSLAHPKMSAPVRSLVGTADIAMFGEKEFARLSGMSFLLGGTQFKVGANLDGVQVPTGSFTVSADNVEIEELLPQKGTEPRSAGPSKAPAKRRTSSDSPLKRASLRGEVVVGKGRYKSIEFSETRLAATLKQGVVTTEELRSNLCGGKLDGSIEVLSAFDQPSVQGRVTLDDTDIKPILALSERAKGMVEGRVSGEFEFKAPQLDPARLLKTLKLDGNVRVPRGQFTGFDLARKLETISQLSGISEAGPENTVFKDLTAEFGFAEERASISPLSMRLEHFDVVCSGTYRLDRSVNMQADAILSEQLSAKNRGSDVQTFFENKDRRVVIPFMATGTLPGIKVSLDLKRLSERAVEKGKERLKEEILKEVVGKKKPGEEKPEEKILREIGTDLLDRVLKR